MKTTVITVVLLVWGTFVGLCAQPSLQAGITETYASGWIPPTTWKLVYDKPVVQSEAYIQLDTPDWKLLKATRLTMWVQNPTDERSAFTPPGGEVDCALGLTGPTFKGVKTSFEIRFIDVGGLRGEDVWTFGDKDVLRLRFRLDYPIKFIGGKNILTPSLTFFHVEPISYRPKVAGNVICPQISYEWKPQPWLRLIGNAGFMHDGGINGGIPADIVSYGLGAGVRINKGSPECWVNAGVHFYNTLGSPINRPDQDFDLKFVSIGFKF